MATTYNLEPPPTGSVVIHTTQGEIAVELFAKQAPLASRNFLQHSLDGYYDGTIFHRLVPGFVLQGGDPTGTGHGGESIYDGGGFGATDADPWPMEQRKGRNAGPRGVGFKDEVHSRLKFNRRGLLGMANEGVPDSNGSQFFFTLGKADELTGKNTMFGRVAGDTIYNLARMGEAEVEEGEDGTGDRPLYPAKITRVEILVNPFEDMRRRERTARREVAGKSAAKQQQQQQKKRKGGGKQLLSFGGDEEGEDGVPAKKVKVDRRIVMDVEEGEDHPVSKPKPKSKSVRFSTKREDDKARDGDEAERKPSKPAPPPPTPPPPPARKDEEKERKPRPDEKEEEEESSPEPEEAQRRRRKTLLERTNEEIAAVKASMKRTIHQAKEPAKEKKKSAFEQLIPENSVRGRKARPAGITVTKEDRETLDLLKAFRSKLGQVAPQEKHDDAVVPSTTTSDTTTATTTTHQNGENGNDGGDKNNNNNNADEEEGEVCDLHFIANCQSCQAWHNFEKEEDSGDDGWMSHTLSCAADRLGKDLSNRKKAEEELVVIDPLEKARNLKDERKGGGGGGGGRSRSGGSSGRAWDQRRGK